MATTAAKLVRKLFFDDWKPKKFERSPGLSVTRRRSSSWSLSVGVEKHPDVARERCECHR